MIMPMKLRTPPASALLAKAAGLPNGGGRPSSDAPVAKLAREQLREIATVKPQPWPRAARGAPHRPELTPEMEQRNEARTDPTA
jgi:hypothetical protein